MNIYGSEMSKFYIFLITSFTSECSKPKLAKKAGIMVKYPWQVVTGKKLFMGKAIHGNVMLYGGSKGKF